MRSRGGSPYDIVVRPQYVQFLDRRFPFAQGRLGRTVTKEEGDLATPRGVHRIIDVFYRADRIAQPCDFARPISPNDGWSDDPKDPAYNHLIRRPHGFGHERLWRSDSLYDLVITTDWNWPSATPGRGSAIFIHQWRSRRYPTAGCIALKREHLYWLASRITKDTQLIVL